ncbi:MAG: hypothetical protein J7647_25860 [Cyanobacteria bacterium SBLK]|nr:hypothetical protein [Cyanobacteria bacterium SBLK]
MRGQGIPEEAILNLRCRLEELPRRSSERRQLVEETAEFYGVSRDTLYRALRERPHLHSVRRTDAGVPRVMSKTTLESYCEAIAALKIRTSNRKGRHLSTVQAIRLLEEHGIETPNGHLQAPEGLLKKTTVNRYLKRWGYDRERLTRQPPVVHFQAECSNDCWHFDLSPSDLKQVKTPVWMNPKRGKPLLMLYSVVDDRVEALAKQLRLPASAIGIVRLPVEERDAIVLPMRDFVDPDPFQEFEFASAIAAKLAIADFLGKPLAKLTPEQLARIDEILAGTLNKEAVFSQIRDDALVSRRPHA